MQFRSSYTFFHRCAFCTVIEDAWLYDIVPLVSRRLFATRRVGFKYCLTTVAALTATMKASFVSKLTEKRVKDVTPTNQ